ncbi:hypothetical protein [Cellulomonas dongxiuzhuiae]|uniref:Minor tail protein n=1 Tax=Cellulomonas dongxiuzhuiae TaxID=2819979 RepID=A0ABX8GGN7_9CELL|nr:hypothetical protein [Cellulomonas dongxiuzhuiae]MBO3093579.1 hypothetical protein [Cellulomonas dongxiuzhuiae]QWC14704.1 hypothetical protein KKR89_09970 [Cellulomonas dongxiuzhuiae]
MLQYFSYVGHEPFRGPLRVASGFELVEVAEVGHRLQTETSAAPVSRVAVNVQSFAYDASTGDLEVGITPLLSTDGQGWLAEVTFVVICTDSGVAHIARVSTGGVGTSEVSMSKYLPGAIPVGMDYVGMATQIWDVGTDAGPLLLNGVAAHVNNLSVTPPNLWLDYWGVLRDSAWTAPMFFEWQALVLAFDPAEMSRATTSLPYQYTWLAHNVVTRNFFAGPITAPPGAPVTGFLDAYEGSVLGFGQLINGPEHRVWCVEASASPPSLTPTGAITSYGTFLGTTYGDTVTTEPYLLQVSRCAAWLH